MEESSRRTRFDSLTFLLGFALGSFIGVALALLAVAVAPNDPAPAPGAKSTVVVLQDVPSVEGARPPAATPDTRPRTRSQLDVRLGPGQSYAIIGVLSRGEAVIIAGRDAEAEWVSVQFPPGSAGRGWIPVGQLDGVTDLYAISVTLPTPLPRTVSIPGTFFGDDGIDRRSTPVPTVRADAARSPTPRPEGPFDLTVSRISLLPDGHVSVVIGNLGPGDLVGQTIFVRVRDLAVRSEQVVSANQTIPAGGSITVQTQYLQISEELEIQATVDPAGSLKDFNRSNNSLSVTLKPQPAPTPAPGSERND